MIASIGRSSMTTCGFAAWQIMNVMKVLPRAMQVRGGIPILFDVRGEPAGTFLFRHQTINFPAPQLMRFRDGTKEHLILRVAVSGIR